MHTTPRGLGFVAAAALVLAAIPEATTACIDANGAEVSRGTLAAQGFRRGFSLVGWNAGDLAAPQAARVMRSMARAGANAVTLVPVWYQATGQSATVDPEQSGAGATLADVIAAARTANSLGLHIAIKPHVDSRDGVWRGAFDPGGAEGGTAARRTWFDSYRARLLRLADVAESTRAGSLVIGTELINLSTDPALEPQWRALIGEVRGRFGGTVTYAGNWGRQDGEYRRIPFWDALDTIGINAYFPLSLKRDPSLTDLRTGWGYFVDERGVRSSWLSDVDGLRRSLRKPVVISEIGYPSTTDAASHPWDYSRKAPVDLRRQSAAYSAALSVWNRVPWLEGIYWWAWSADATEGGRGDPGYSPQGKPALGVLTKWYGAAATQRCLPVEPSLAAVLPVRPGNPFP